MNRFFPTEHMDYGSDLKYQWKQKIKAFRIL